MHANQEDPRRHRTQLSELAVPFLTVIGNHDAISNGRIIYHAMFGPHDYVFQYGGARFVCLNANPLEFGTGTPDLTWLRTVTEVGLTGRPAPSLRFHARSMWQAHHLLC